MGCVMKDIAAPGHFPRMGLGYILLVCMYTSMASGQ